MSDGKKGCFFYGCLTVIVGGVLLVVVVGVGGYLGLRHVVHTYTAAQPMELPPYQVDDQQAQELGRVLLSLDPSSREPATAPVRLTADQVNYLNAQAFDLEGKTWFRLNEVMRFEFVGDKTRLHLSVPLDFMGYGMLKGRHLNGVATVNMRYEDGLADIRVPEIELNGKKLPKEFIESFNEDNLAEKANREGKLQELLSGVRRIFVENGVLVIEPAAGADPAVSAEPVAEEPVIEPEPAAP